MGEHFFAPPGSGSEKYRNWLNSTVQQKIGQNVCTAPAPFIQLYNITITVRERSLVEKSVSVTVWKHGKFTVSQF